MKPPESAEPCASPLATFEADGGRPCCREGCRLHTSAGCVVVLAEVNGPMTTRQVAAVMGVSHQRVRQIELAGIVKLKSRRAHVLRALRVYLEPDARPAGAPRWSRPEDE